MIKGFRTAVAAGAVALAGLSVTAQADTAVNVTVSSVICKLDPADMPPVTPSLAAGIAAGSKFALAYNNFLPFAQRGDTEAQRRLGNLMVHCAQPEDRAMGRSWLEKAADAGDTQAAYSLGGIYMNGNGVAQDDDKAFILMSKAANAGMMEAQGTLGYLYSSGRGTSKDAYQSVVWTVKAAEQGGLTSLYNIARDYSEGTGLPQDNDKAARYMYAAFVRTPPNERPKWATLINGIANKLDLNDRKEAAQRALHWAPGKDSLSDVLDDANRLQKRSG
jgi:TPR repeat protein